MNRSGWLVSEEFDLWICCGGLMWLAVLVHFALFGVQAAPVWLVAVLTHLFADTHIAATWHKLFAERKLFESVSVAACTYFVGVLLLAVLFDAGVRQVFFDFLPLAVIPHYARQSYGIALMYCSRNGMQLSIRRKRLLSSALNVAAASLMARQLSPTAFPILQSGHLHSPHLVPVWVVDSLWTLACGVSVLLMLDYCSSARNERLPYAALFLVLSTIALMLAPNAVVMLAWIYAPMLFHGTQYLAVTMQRQVRREGAVEGMLVFEYFGKLFMIAAAVYALLPHAVGIISPHWVAAGAAVLACITLHHALVDSFIWRKKHA